MQVEQLKVTHWEARKAVRYYAAAVKERHSEEWKTLLAGYRAILRNKTVIDLRASIVNAGTDAQGRPRLAAVRADCGWVTAERHGGNGVMFRSYLQRHDWYDRRGRAARIAVKGFATGIPIIKHGDKHRAIAPSIPPQHMPASGKLHEFVMLFEAEWQAAPVDPFLLKPLGGSLYAVVAQWDLSPLERAVLANSRLSE